MHSPHGRKRGIPRLDVLDLGRVRDGVVAQVRVSAGDHLDLPGGEVGEHLRQRARLSGKDTEPALRPSRDRLRVLGRLGRDVPDRRDRPRNRAFGPFDCRRPAGVPARARRESRRRWRRAQIRDGEHGPDRERLELQTVLAVPGVGVASSVRELEVCAGRATRGGGRGGTGQSDDRKRPGCSGEDAAAADLASLSVRGAGGVCGGCGAGHGGGPICGSHRGGRTATALAPRCGEEALTIPGFPR